MFFKQLVFQKHKIVSKRSIMLHKKLWLSKLCFGTLSYFCQKIKRLICLFADSRNCVVVLQQEKRKGSTQYVIYMWNCMIEFARYFPDNGKYNITTDQLYFHFSKNKFVKVVMASFSTYIDSSRVQALYCSRKPVALTHESI